MVKLRDFAIFLLKESTQYTDLVYIYFWTLHKKRNLNNVNYGSCLLLFHNVRYIWHTSLGPFIHRIRFSYHKSISIYCSLWNLSKNISFIRHTLYLILTFSFYILKIFASVYITYWHQNSLFIFFKCEKKEIFLHKYAIYYFLYSILFRKYNTPNCLALKKFVFGMMNYW